MFDSELFLVLRYALWVGWEPAWRAGGSSGSRVWTGGGGWVVCWVGWEVGVKVGGAGLFCELIGAWFSGAPGNVDPGID